MKVFVAYKYTGEDFKELQKTIPNICKTIDSAGNGTLCSFFNEDFYKEKKYSTGQILKHVFKEIEKADCLLAFIQSPEKSEGMLLEIGYALALDKKFILAIKKGLETTFLHEMADQVIEFENIEELHTKLKKIS